MKIEITYPAVPKRRLRRKRFLAVMKWLFMFAAYMCPILNVVAGGKAWSIVVLISLYSVWTLLLSTDLVEYNRMSQFIKLVACSSALLFSIDVFLSPGWAADVIPIVCFSALLVSGVLFFTDFERQKQNMLPLLLLIFASVGLWLEGHFFRQGENHWAPAVMAALALALLAACAASLGSEFIRELRRRFHTK